MNSKKLFIIAVLAFTLTSGVALAATTPTAPATAPAPTTMTAPGAARVAPRPLPVQNPIKYTAAQQTCINNTIKSQQAAIKAATDTLNAATKDARTTQQAAIKAATDTFNAATKNASDVRTNAMNAAQKMTNLTNRAAAFKSAINNYNNNVAVVQAEIPYQTAMKAADDAFNKDPSVVKAQGPYQNALKGARTDIIKTCTTSTPSVGTSLWQIIVHLFSK